VVGIKLLDDPLLDGAVLTPTAKDFMVLVSENGWAKRMPLKEIPSKGRGTQGVQILSVTATTGCAVGIGIGNRLVDIYASDGRRIRMGVASLPKENRPNRGESLAPQFGDEAPKLQNIRVR
jgi:DNA gyrase subunit A